MKDSVYGDSSTQNVRNKTAKKEVKLERNRLSTYLASQKCPAVDCYNLLMMMMRRIEAGNPFLILIFLKGKNKY